MFCIKCIFRKYVETVSELLKKKPESSDKAQVTKDNISQALNFQALIRPNKTQLDHVSQISRLEERLRKLEATIGSGALTLVRILISRIFIFKYFKRVIEFFFFSNYLGSANLVLYFYLSQSFTFLTSPIIVFNYFHPFLLWSSSSNFYIYLKLKF